jgi:glycosyltransferase involved in cell wall biosynthesis
MTIPARESTAIPDVSVVIPTHNRSAQLRRTLASVLSQQTHRRYEVIVVDNNSTDDTKAEVERVIAGGAPVHYLIERKQGVSYTRNAGIAVANAPLLVFVDDDVWVDADWMEAICRTLEEHPELDCVGGKILPEWEGVPPPWLTRDHWAPLALIDFGDRGRIVNTDNRRCLLTGNFACRRETFERVGFFGTALQRVHDGIGSMEDHEWLIRFWDAGREAMYVPEMQASTHVPPQRMTRTYHRQWHFGHGHYFALLREPEFELSKAGRLFDVPAHVYRAAVQNAFSWLSQVCRGNRTGAFLFETRLCFLAGYFLTRVAQYFRRLWRGRPVAALSDESEGPQGNTGVAPS